MPADSRVAALHDVPEDSTLVFTVRDRESGDDEEAILVRVGDGVACWRNYCQHLTHIKLDKGSGAQLRGGEILCTNHGAYFEADTGFCTHGPCEGAYLDAVEVTVEDGDVYLADDRYEFVHVGPMATDDLDRSSTSNVEF
jgi:nitrite reductase/ring-hydroxylating ferredoxin subunit